MASLRIAPPFLILLLFLSACGEHKEQPRAVGEAFTGPVSLNIRTELGVKSPVVATVKHGERLEILQRRRRFAQVRTAQGVIGWVDGRLLMSPEQMADLRTQAQRYTTAPSMGAATVYSALNIHTEPNRQAPSFHQIREKDTVDVIAHRMAPRTPYQPVVVAAEPKPQPVRRRRAKSEETVPPPAPAPAPKPPDNWIELSKTLAEEDPDKAETPPPPPPPGAAPVRMDDWSLVRTRDGKVGWMLTGMLTMTIPDDVAQYAEGHRITSYFPLADVKDGDETKHHWLWTTLSKPPQPYEFDSFRVFIYSQRKHRYETAYIERNLKGYFPVEMHPVEVTQGKKRETVPGFSLVTEDKDGRVWKRTYAFQVYRLPLIRKTPWERPPEAAQPARPNNQLAQAQLPPSPGETPSWYTRIKQKVKGMFQR